MTLLRIESVYVNFGGLQALTDVSMNVQQGIICALVGPNGSGKTTLFNTISNIVHPNDGQVFFDGERIDHLSPHLIAGKGISRTFQIVSLFAQAACWENVANGAFSKTRAGVFPIILRLPKARHEEKRIQERAMEALQFFGIETLAYRPAGLLPIGQQRLVEMARALLSEPKLLLLDEPLSGLNPRESEVLQRKVLEINRKGVTILFVEHEMKAVMRLANNIVVLNFGKKIAEGPPDKIRNNQEVIDIYLGRETHLAGS